MQEKIAVEQNQRDQPQDRSPGAEELLKIAAQAQELVVRISSEPGLYRRAGRLVRLSQFLPSALSEEELVAFVEALSGADEQQSSGSPGSLFLLHTAIEQVSDLIWEEMWISKQLTCFKKPSKKQDYELRSLWREKVRGLLRRCGHDAVFSSTPKEYADELIGAGASEQDADRLANWLSEVLGGTTGPS
jgi:hypothetical protein